MDKVFCNTSPLQYLFQLGKLELLNELYGVIAVPDPVVQELERGRKLGVSLPNVHELPWVEVRNPHGREVLKLVTMLGPGEASVLALGLENHGATLLLDDLQARRYAEINGLKYTGTLGILVSAKRAGHLREIKPIIEHLDELGFRVSKRMKEVILHAANE